MRHGGPVITKFAPTRMTGPSRRPQEPAVPAPRTVAAAPPISGLSAGPGFTGSRSSSSAPTPEFRSDHDVLPPQVDEHAFRQGWFVRSRALALFENHEINGAEYGTVVWWRRSVEQLGRMRVQTWIARVDGGRLPGDRMTEAELAAAAAVRNAARAIGARRVGLLLAAVIEDRSWYDIGRKLDVSHKTAKLRAIEAIRALHLWRIGEPVPPPPPERFRNQPSSW